MSDVDIRVSTEPLAREVDRVTSGIARVSLNVESYQDELVNAENEASEKISNKITHGFFMLTRNELSQRMVAYENEAMNSMVIVTRFMKDLAEIRNRMEKDYNQISARYIRIFSRLEKGLDKSIHELDKALMKVMDEGFDKIDERMLLSLSKSVSYPCDVISSSNVLLLSYYRRKAISILSQLDNHIKEMKKLDEMLSSVLSSDFQSSKGKYIFLPVVITSSSSFSGGEDIVSISLPVFPSSIGKSANEIKSDVLDDFLAEEDWVALSSVEKNILRNEFISQIEDQDERKKEIMLRLFDSSPLLRNGG